VSALPGWTHGSTSASAAAGEARDLGHVGELPGGRVAAGE